MGQIPYRVIRSQRKTMSLGLGDGLEIVVRVPHRMPSENIEAFIAKHRDWITDKLEKRRAYLERYPTPTEEQLAIWMEQAKSIIPDRVAYFTQIMGVTPSGLRYTKNGTRIGSCTGCNRLSFSCRLMRYPLEVLDYVVVHELAHITHKNHGPDFWAAVAAVLPDYRALRRILRDH